MTTVMTMTTLIARRRFTTTVGIVVLLVAAPWWTTRVVASPSTRPDASVSQARSAVRSDSTYADGRYTATGWYGGLPSSITVTVTLADGVLTAVRVRPNATVPTSLDLQRRFAAAVPSVVVGKRIDEVHVGRLAGSSGTPKGFNDALRQIREQAGADRRPRGVTRPR